MLTDWHLPKAITLSGFKCTHGKCLIKREELCFHYLPNVTYRLCYLFNSDPSDHIKRLLPDLFFRICFLKVLKKFLCFFFSYFFLSYYSQVFIFNYSHIFVQLFKYVWLIQKKHFFFFSKCKLRGHSNNTW
jgi:hypothetical protein